jgi:hypothetical protein
MNSLETLRPKTLTFGGTLLRHSFFQIQLLFAPDEAGMFWE